MCIKTTLNVDIGELQEAIDYIDEVNSVDFEDIVWWKNGEEIYIPDNIKINFAETKDSVLDPLLILKYFKLSGIL